MITFLVVWFLGWITAMFTIALTNNFDTKSQPIPIGVAALIASMS